jgi:malate dehydrogenase
MFLIHFLLFQGLNVDDFARGKLDVTGKELLEEKEEALSVCQDSNL